MIFWLVMSGMLQPVQIGEGIACSIIVIAINYRLKAHKFFDDEIDHPGRIRFSYVPRYVVWLLFEMIKAGLHVASVIISPSKSTETRIVKFRVDLPNAQAKMVLGNSITLTPGTVTVDIRDDKFTVHALTKNSFGGIVDDSMPRKVLRLFEKEERQVVHDVQIINDADQISRK
ncbi:MAG: Na+/H+ antiporter subunit E [Balneolaceae bacterium]